MSDLTERLREFALWVAPTTPKELVVSEAADLIDAIDALHHPDLPFTSSWCVDCDQPWPCSTHLLIHPTPKDGQCPPRT